MGARGKRRLLAGAGLALLAVTVVLVVMLAGGGGRGAARHPTAGGKPPVRTTTSGSTTSTTATPSPGSGTSTTGTTSTTAAPVTAVPTPAPAGPPAHPAPAGVQVGANVNVLFDSREHSLAQIDAQLRDLRATGATIARSDALWELAEPAPPSGGVHHYSWAFDDAIAGALASNRLVWLPIVDYSAPWAQAAAAGAHPPPASTSNYASFAAALAARYGSGGSFWNAHPELPRDPVDTYEIWNEPDSSVFWSTAPEPARYAELYLSARAAIEAVDPAARVIVGGLTNPGATSPGGFLAQMVGARRDLPGHVDGVAIHPYASRPEGVLGHIRAARALLRALGMGTVPLYVTEFGWTTRPANLPHWALESRRPAYIARTVGALGHTDCRVATVILYTWLSPERNPADENDWYGINPAGGGASRAADAFAAGQRAATRPGPSINLCGGP